MNSRDEIKNVFQQLRTERFDRRILLKRAALLGATLSASGTLLAACSDADDDADVDAQSDDAASDDNDTVADDAQDDVADNDEDTDEPADDVPEDDRYGGEVTWFHGSAPATLNPLFSTSHREIPIERLIFGALAKINDENQPELDLAETLDASEDATTYTFTLYDGIMFTDGEQLTSDDVRFTVERAINPQTASPWRGRFTDIEGFDEFSDGSTDSVEGISTPDDLTIEFSLSQPNGIFLSQICFVAGLGILPKHHLEDVAPEDMEDHEFSSAPTVSAGAFKFVQWAPDQYVELERNEDYFREGVPYLDRLFGMIMESSVGTAQMETGDLDIFPELPYNEMERTEALEHVTVNSVPSPSVFKLIINCERFDDVRIRQAFAYAVDKHGLMDAAVAGQGTVMHHPFAWDWTRDVDDIIEYEYDPDRARELLEEAGWDFDQKVVLTDTFSRPWRELGVTIVQDMMREAGIQFEIDLIESAEYNRRLQEADFDLHTRSAEPPDPGQHEITSTQHPPQGRNSARYSNDRIDELMLIGRSTLDMDERREAYEEAARILNEDVPELDLFAFNNVSAYNKRVGGVSPPALRDNTLWNAEEWYIIED